MFSADLSVELINTVIIAAGVCAVALKHGRNARPRGPLLIRMEQTWCCVNAFVWMTLAYQRLGEFNP